MASSKISQDRLKCNPYRQDEPVEGSYLRIPKCLFDDQYNGLSSDAKLLYGLLLDRMELSRKNGWINEQGEIFIHFLREDLKNLLSIGKNKVTELFKELRKYGLIREKRQGVKKANVIYVGKVAFSSLTPEKRDSRLPENKLLDSLKPGGSKTEFNDLEFSDPEKKEKGSFAKVETSSCFFNPNNYSSLANYTYRIFMRIYMEIRKEEHPVLKPQQLKRCFTILDRFIIDNELEDETQMDNIVSSYFRTKFPNANNGWGCDYRFNHFCTEGVLQNRFWEEIY